MQASTASKQRIRSRAKVDVLTNGHRTTEERCDMSGARNKASKRLQVNSSQNAETSRISSANYRTALPCAATAKWSGVEPKSSRFLNPLRSCCPA
eukprot:gene558-3875_t